MHWLTVGDQVSRNKTHVKTVHHQEREQFKRLFKQQSVGRFEDRLQLLDAFLETEQHVTSAELQGWLAERGDAFDLGFVAETLKLLCQFGFAKQNRFADGQIRYEHRHLGQHHDHMVCTQCGGIQEFKDDSLERLQIKIAATYGFHMLQHKMELYGICADCLKIQGSRMALTLTKPGEQVVVREIQGGLRARGRLLSMGIRPGEDIFVISNQGQLVVSLNDSRLVIGEGLAQKIIVEHVKR